MKTFITTNLYYNKKVVQYFFEILYKIFNHNLLVTIFLCLFVTILLVPYGVPFFLSFHIQLIFTTCIVLMKFLRKKLYKCQTSIILIK